MGCARGSSGELEPCATCVGCAAALDGESVPRCSCVDVRGCPRGEVDDVFLEASNHVEERFELVSAKRRHELPFEAVDVGKKLIGYASSRWADQD